MPRGLRGRERGDARAGGRGAAPAPGGREGKAADMEGERERSGAAEAKASRPRSRGKAAKRGRRAADARKGAQAPRGAGRSARERNGRAVEAEAGSRAGERPQPERPRGRDKAAGGPRPVRIALLGGLLVLSLAALLWTYTGTGVLNVKHVEVRGASALGEEYLRALSGITPETHLLKMDVKAVEKALLSEPCLAAVEVRRRFPDTVVLEVSERRPSGVIVQNGRFLLVDQGGVVLASVEEMPPGLVEIRDLQLPLLLPGNKVSGLDFAMVTSLLGSLPAPLRERTQVVGLRHAHGLYLEANGALVIYGEADDLSRKNAVTLMALGVLLPRYGAVEYIDVSLPEHAVIKPSP